MLFITYVITYVFVIHLSFIVTGDSCCVVIYIYLFMYFTCTFHRSYRQEPFQVLEQSRIKEDKE
jgi:hypothetical protein